MDVSDEEFLRRLEARDGPLGWRWRSYRDAGGACRYAEMYPDGDCPWCASEARRAAAGAPRAE